MGQFHDTTMSTNVPFDEKSDNGLIVGDRYLPVELLAEIFCYVDYKTLMNCQLVCKRWKILIQSYVWHKKAEMAIGQSLPPDKDTPWYVYCTICKKKPFERNLVKNHSGQNGIKKYWKILNEGGDKWKVESPPVGVPPLPLTDPVFEGKESCFVTSYQSCIKAQTIDLEAEGLIPYILDKLQPPIVVSEWYSCRWDCPAMYECSVMLLGADNNVLDSFQFRDDIEGETQNQWHRVSHEFQNYGPGLRKICFCHGGVDKLFWANHYGSKMAGACVIVKIPTTQYSNTEGGDSLLDIDD